MIISMTTLQRSAYSFRRQGSSGRIWDNQLQRAVSKSSELHAAGTSTTGGGRNHQEYIFRDEELADPHAEVGTSRTKNNQRGSSIASSHPSRPENKAQGCALVAIFRRCVGSPA
ncbi:hypothetical protein LguiA_018533 [Lonicera macranthoides]